MKNRMPLRKSVGKISTFLRSLKSTNSDHSESRSNRRGYNYYPNSVKVGAGNSFVRRALPYTHKRNHRDDAVIIGMNR